MEFRSAVLGQQSWREVQCQLPDIMISDESADQFVVGAVANVGVAVCVSVLMLFCSALICVALLRSALLCAVLLCSVLLLICFHLCF